MSATKHLGLKLTAADEISMTFYEWRTLMNGVGVDSNMELIDAAIERLNTTTNGKADGFVFNDETGVLQLTSGGEPLPKASVLIDINGFYTKEEVDAMVEDASREASVGTIEWDESTRTLTMYNGNGDMIGDPIVIEGGGAAGGYNFSITLKNLLESRAITVAEGGDVELKFSYTSVDENEADDGNGVGSLIVNNVKMATLTVAQGENTIDIKKYLNPGENTVKLKVENSENSAKTLIYTVSVVALSVATSFDTMGIYSGDVLFTYTPTGSGEKTIHFLMDGTEIGTQKVSSSSRSKDYIIPAQNHGGHTLQVYATMGVGEITVRSNTLTLGMMWLDGSMVPAIMSPFVITQTMQGEALMIPYMVCDPASETANVQLSIIDNEGATYSTRTINVDRTAQNWSVSDYPLGNVKFRIACGDVYTDLSVTVLESTFQLEPIRDGLELEFSAAGRSNGEENPATWSYGDNINATFSGFGWVADGWHDDDDGATCLRFLPGDKMEIPFEPFNRDIRTSGLTIEVDMATRDVRDYDSVVLSSVSNGRGFKIASQYAMMKSEQSEVQMQFKEDSRVRVAMVVENRNLHRLIYIYINGVMCGVTQYAESDDFAQSPAVGLTIGAESCGIDLYGIRIYNKGLTRAEELDNYIYDKPTLLERRESYERNDVLDDSDEIVISKLPPDLAYMIISCAELPQFKGDKKQGVEITYVNPADTARNFTASGVQLDVQGTSSAGYKKKNFKFVLKNGLTYTTSGEMAELYQLYANAIPVDTFCLKADVASSENANNVMLVDYYNELCPYKTPPQQTDSRVRQGIYGSPCVVFWHNPNTNETRFWSKYNFNNDKSTAETFGLTAGCESWEFRNNTSQRCIFKSADFSGTDWQNDFEARYPDGSTDISKLKAVFEWVVSTDRDAATGNALSSPVTYGDTEYTNDTADYRLAKFKAEFDQHFIKDAMLFYYLFTEIFLMVDSRAKNLFLSTYDGTHWLPLPYDFDTALGISGSHKTFSNIRRTPDRTGNAHED